MRHFNLKMRQNISTMHHNTFLSRDAMPVRMPLSCVCLSVTTRCSTEMAKHTIMQRTPHDSTKISAKLKRRHPQRSRQMHAGYWRDAARRAGLSATADTCFGQDRLFAVH